MDSKNFFSVLLGLTSNKDFFVNSPNPVALGKFYTGFMLALGEVSSIFLGGSS
jgi:hypothetical protein